MHAWYEVVIIVLFVLHLVPVYGRRKNVGRFLKVRFFCLAFLYAGFIKLTLHCFIYHRQARIGKRGTCPQWRRQDLVRGRGHKTEGK